MAFKKNAPGCRCCQEEGKCCSDCVDEVEIEFYDSGASSLGSCMLSKECGGFKSLGEQRDCCRPIATRAGLGIIGWPCEADATTAFPKGAGCAYWFEGKVEDVFTAAKCSKDNVLVVVQFCGEGITGFVHSCIDNDLDPTLCRFFPALCRDKSKQCCCTGWEWFQKTSGNPDCDTIGTPELTIPHIASVGGGVFQPAPDCGGFGGNAPENCFDDDEAWAGAGHPPFTDLDFAEAKIRP